MKVVTVNTSNACTGESEEAAPLWKAINSLPATTAAHLQMSYTVSVVTERKRKAAEQTYNNSFDDAHGAKHSLVSWR